MSTQTCPDYNGPRCNLDGRLKKPAHRRSFCENPNYASCQNQELKRTIGDAIEEMLKNTPDTRADDDGEPYFEGDIPADLDRMTRSDDPREVHMPRAQSPAKLKKQCKYPLPLGEVVDGTRGWEGHQLM